MDTNSHYIQGDDHPIVDGLPMSVSCRMDDQAQITWLRDVLSGVTAVNGKSTTTYKATTSVTIAGAAVTTPSFADGTKMAYRVEVLWDGSNDYGWALNEVYFEPREQNVTEGEDSVMINMNGLIFGAISPITSFTSGVTFGRN
jgi:hypothetical protein